MVNRQYGTSGYRPSSHRQRPEQTSLFKKLSKAAKMPKLPKNPFKRLAGRNCGTWILGIAILLLLILWLSLGSFRFLLSRIPASTGLIFGNRTYIVLFQNNYELRPTGGFISTYGELKFSHGVPTGIDFYDVYGEIDEHDFVEPPLVLSALLDGEGYQGHSFRDANVDPDFTLSKEALLEFYALTNPDQRVDGVIAADFHFLEELVGLYEPLSVDGYELTENNLFETLSTAVSDIDRHNEEALANRKNITSPLVKKVIRKSLLTPWRLNRFLDTVERGFEEKHVLATFNRRRLEKAFAKRGWNGALPNPDRGDVLIVNDANYGGMKSNRYITRDVQYELDVSDARDVLGNPVVTGTLTITLSHEGIWNIPLSGAYTGYLRSLIPMGADVVEGSTVTETREDFEVLGELVELQPGESISYSYTYVLPEYVWKDGVYELKLHKQPGTIADRYRVVVRVPQGKSIDDQSGEEAFDIRENLAFFETELETDQSLRFSILEDQNPPRVISHEFTALNEITIIFNEAVSTDYAGDPLNYQIADLNFAEGEVTDAVAIESIRVDGAAVILTTTGITYQPEERYELSLRDLRDNSGNRIEPSPRTLTVIQRESLLEDEAGEATEETALDDTNESSVDETPSTENNPELNE